MNAGKKVEGKNSWDEKWMNVVLQTVLHIE
jgi:hypothetical protein